MSIHTGKSWWRRRPLALVSMVLASLLAMPSPAAVTGAPLTLSAAIQRALAANPSISQSELTLSAQRARQQQLAQATPWTIGVELENVAGSGPFTGLDRAETTVGVSRVLELGDKRELRAALGDAGSGLVTAAHRAMRVDIAARVANAFSGALAAQDRLQVSEEFRALAEAVRDTVNRRVTVGRSAEAELATAEIGLARARNAGHRSASTLESRRRQLAALMAQERPAFGNLSGNLLELPQVADFATLKARLDGNAELARSSQEQRLRAAERQLAEAERRPDLTLGAGVRRLAETDDTALVLSFSMPLGQRGRAAPGIEAATAREAAAPLAGTSRRLELTGKLYDLTSRLLATAHELGVLKEEIIPVAERAVNLYQEGFERGRYPLFELIAAQRTLLDARRDAIDAAENYHSLAIAIQHMLGEMPGGGAQP